MWLHIPSECSVYAADTADSTSPSDSHFLQLERSATLSGKFHASAFWRREWRKGRLSPLRFGAMSAPSTDADGLDAWISSWRDSPVNHTHLQASEKAQPMPAGQSGTTSSASRGSAQLELFSLRTSPDCSQVRGGNPLPKSEQIWTMQAIRFKPPASWVLAMSGHHTAVIDSLSWPTPRACETPGGAQLKQNGRALSADALKWPTPSTSDTNGAGHHGDGAMDLRTTVRQWATPATRDYKDTGANVNWQAIADKTRLPGQAMVWSAESLHQDKTPTGQPLTHDSGQRQLNPVFVEWLMGLPEGWTSVERTG